eukprot:3913889-Pyramimonas_sp.AAC.1
MRLISTTRAGLESARFALINGVCDTCRERRAWEKPGHAVMPSTALPGKVNEEAECDRMFYKQEHPIFHSIDRCIRYGTGMKIPDTTFGPAKVLYSDGEGALKDTAQAALRAEGAELRMRARGQRATTIETRSAYYAIYFTSWKRNSKG